MDWNRDGFSVFLKSEGDAPSRGQVEQVFLRELSEHIFLERGISMN
jgi:hypothetical protein